MKDNIIVYTVILLIGSLIWVIKDWPSSNLKIYFCNVGQADQILITQGFMQILVDGGVGKNGWGCINKHLPFWDKEIDLVAISHFEDDHVGIVPEIVRRYRVGLLVYGDQEGFFKDKYGIQKIAKSRSVKTQILSMKDKIRVGKIELLVLWPPKQDPDSIMVSATSGKDENNAKAMAILVKYGEFQAVLTGDIGAEQELAIAESGVLGQVPLLKVAHHGSKFSTSKIWLDLVKPKIAVVSVGKSNRYGHPAPETITRLMQAKTKLFRTDIDGEVVFASDGKGLWKE